MHFLFDVVTFQFLKVEKKKYLNTDLKIEDVYLAFYFSHYPQYFRLFACLISAIVLSDILADTW